MRRGNEILLTFFWIELFALLPWYQIFKKNLLLQNQWKDLKTFCTERFLNRLYQSCSMKLIPLKNMAITRGHAYFPYMSYIEKLEKFFSETIGRIWRIFGTCWMISHKDMAARGKGRISLYNFIENLKKVFFMPPASMMRGISWLSCQSVRTKFIL